MDNLFDLNIEKVLEHWGVEHAIREIIANALDEMTLTGTKEIEISYSDGVCHIRDYGRGLQYIHFRFLYKGIIIKHNKTEPTYTKTSLFLCEKRRFFMARTEKGVVATI